MKILTNQIKTLGENNRQGEVDRVIKQREY